MKDANMLPSAMCDIEIAGYNAKGCELDHGAELLLIPRFLSAEERTILWEAAKGYPWERQKVMGMVTLRSNVWFAEDPTARYKYSGQSWEPRPLPTELRALGQRLREVLREDMNSILGTYYPHGRSGVDYHADDEPLLGKNPTVASVSIGATRTFQVAKGSGGKARRADLELELHDGDLVIMRGTFQHHFQHAVKKASQTVGPRLNLSYRRVVEET